MATGNWKKLAERFCPQITFSGQGNRVETLKPSSIDWYLEKCHVFDPKTLVGAPVNIDTLGNYTKKEQYLIPSGDFNNGHVPTAKIYAHLMPSIDDTLAIQYWVFYPKNGNVEVSDWPDVGEHIGDWEHVTVIVENWKDNYASSTARAVFTSRHSGGAWHGVNGISWVSTTHPKVYAAWHSHAFYTTTGKHVIDKWTTTIVSVDNVTEGDVWPAVGDMSSVVQVVQVDFDKTEYTDVPEPANWLKFRGRWGNSSSIYAKSPTGPSQKKEWREGDGYTGFATLGSVGTSWSDSREATGVAFCEAFGESFMGVSRDQGDSKNDRAIIYKIELTDGAAAKLVQFAQAGDDWSASRSCTSIAMGPFGNQDKCAVALGRDAGDEQNAKLIVYELEEAGGNLAMLASTGQTWNSKTYVRATAFGHLNDASVLGACKSASAEKRFVIYKYDAATKDRLAEVASGGANWDSDTGATAMAFGSLADGTHVVAVSRTGAGSKVDKYFLYRYEADAKKSSAGCTHLVELASSGDSWSGGQDAVGIACAKLGNDELVIGVATNSSAGDRFGLFRYTNNALTKIAGSGNNWKEHVRATSIAFGVYDSQMYVAVGRTSTDDNVKIYRLVEDYTGTKPVYAFEEIHSAAVSRTVNRVAWGLLGSHAIMGYAKDNGSGSRCAVLQT